MKPGTRFENPLSIFLAALVSHIGDGNIITNRHVVGEHTEGFVQAYAERESNMPKHDFTVVGKGDSHTDDIAMVSTDATHLPSLELGDPANLEKDSPSLRWVTHQARDDTSS